MLSVLALDGTQILVAMIGAFAVFGTAGLATLGKWLDRKLDEKAEVALTQNTSEHGETKSLLQSLVVGQARVESKIDGHITFHAHQTPQPEAARPQMFVVHGEEITDL